MQAYSPAALQKQDFKHAPTKDRAEKYTERQVCRCRVDCSANHDDGFPKSMGDGFDVCESQKMSSLLVREICLKQAPA
jgi:hypothetical protein